MFFWGLAGGIGLLCLALVFAPVLRGAVRGQRRASYDLQIYRDQLREVAADRGRGVLSADEAEAMRIEVSRRLLAAADTEAAEAGATAAPRLVSGFVTPGLALVAGVGALVLYGNLGAPQMPDQPRALRLARDAAAHAERPGQDAVEALIAREAPPGPPRDVSPEDLALVDRLREVLAGRPDDVEGHRLLARSLAVLGRFAEAQSVQGRVIGILGAQATPADLVDHAELMILAANGWVSPEAEALVVAALERAPEDPRGRYYSGLTLLQAGRPDLAHPIWARLLAEGPADAPWVATIESEIDAVAVAAGLPPRDPSEARGPSAADIDAAGDMSVEDRRVMIEGMVAQLGARLARDGGPAADWAQLIRALAVLGRAGEAAEILAEARTAFAEDTTALATVDAAARGSGIGP